MMDHQLWNTKELLPPPAVTLPFTRQELPTELQDVEKNLQLALDLKRCDGLWAAEKYVLQRMIYRFNNCFRSTKILKVLKKINRCLCIIEDLNIPSLLITLVAGLSREREVDGNVYLPSRQSVEYIETKLVGVTALYGQSINYCIQAYGHSQEVLNQGSYIPNMLVLSALVSRIRQLSLSTVRRLCILYQSLHQMAAQLKPSPVSWLPEGAELPEDLLSWLQEQGYSSTETVHSQHRKEQLTELLSRFSTNDMDSEDLLQLSENKGDALDTDMETAQYLWQQEGTEATGTEGEALLGMKVTQQPDTEDVGEALSRKKVTRQPDTDDVGEALSRKKVTRQPDTEDVGEALSRKKVTRQPDTEDVREALSRKKVTRQPDTEDVGEALSRKKVNLQPDTGDVGEALSRKKVTQQPDTEDVGEALSRKKVTQLADTEELEGTDQSKKNNSTKKNKDKNTTERPGKKGRLKKKKKSAQGTVKPEVMNMSDIVQSCKTGKDLLVVMQQFDLKMSAQTHGIKGFARLKKAVKSLSEGEDRTFRDVQKSLVRFIKKVQSKTQHNHSLKVDDGVEMQSVKPGAKAKEQTSVKKRQIVSIEDSSVRRYVDDTVTTPHQLRRFMKDLVKSGNVYRVGGQMYKLPEAGAARLARVIQQYTTGTGKLGRTPGEDQLSGVRRVITKVLKAGTR